MLRRGLILFIALVLLLVALTAAYTLLPFRSPQDMLAEAQAKLRRGEAAAAVQLLDLCEQPGGLRENPELQAKLRRLRLEAHTRLDNPRRALEDVEALLRDGVRDSDLWMQRVYWLSRADQGEAARERALELVLAFPDLARAQELAGEACQVAYRDQLRDLSKQLRTDLGYQRERAGIDAFLEFLYRPDGDPSVPAALARLQQVYEHEPRFRQSWGRVREQATSLRDAVQQALGYFQRALELGRTDATARGEYLAAAQRATSFALQQADRGDDLVAQSEIYLTNYDHRFTGEAAAAAAAAHVRDGLYEAAIDVVDRYLPPGSERARLAAGKLDRSVEDALTQKALALYRLGRANDLNRFASELHTLCTEGVQARLVPPLGAGLAGVLKQGNPHTAFQLAAVTGMLQDRPAPQDADDPLDLLVPLQLAVAVSDGAKASALLEIVSRWTTARPGSLLPLRARARLQFQLDQPAAAMATAAQVLATNPVDEEALHVLAQAADAAFRESSQNGDALLLQCLQRDILRPDAPPHPVCLLLCAEAALRQQRPDIARASARAAADSFPWSSWPRLLEARAEILAGNSAAAIAILARAIEHDPTDTEAIALWFDTSLGTSAQVASLLPHAVRSLPASADVHAALLRDALAAPATAPATAMLARAAAARPDASAELLALVAQALARTGDATAARAVLQRSLALPAATSAPAAAAQAAAAIAVVVAMAGTTPDADLAAVAAALLRPATLAGPMSAAALLDAAARLAQSRPRTAYLLTATALASGDALECRDADSFRLAGRLATALGDFDVARAHYTAALSFQGGDAAAEPLARLQLLADDATRAAASVRLATEPTDPALLLLAGADGAAELAQRCARADAADLLAAVPFALTSEVDTQAIGADLRGTTAPVRAAALRLVTLLADPRLCAAALPAARALAKLHGESRTVGLLLARALGEAGQPREAAQLHADLFAAGCRELPLFGEVARARSRSPDYVVPEAIGTELRQRALAAPGSLPPLLLVAVAHDVAVAAATAGQPQIAMRVMTDLWLRLPEASGATLANAGQLEAAGLTTEALGLLQKLRGLGTPEQRREANNQFYSLAIRYQSSLGPVGADALRLDARAQLEAGTALSGPLAFLLADPLRIDALAAPALRLYTAQILSGSCRGTEDWSVARAMLGQVQQRQGTAEALATVDTAIAAHPSAAHLWLERARLLAELRRGREGLDDARRMLAYVEAPELALDLLVMAAEQRALKPADHELLARLPAALLETPAGCYARGLVELRRGKADAAETLLLRAAPRASGFHLYARALANLMRSAPEARDRARELFVTLGENYASSSLARNAGSFARQLSPD